MRFLFSLAAPALLVTLAACGDSASDGGSSGTQGSGANGAGGAGSGAGGAPSSGSFTGGGGTPVVGGGCSGDLKSVVDENGVVITTCPPEEGCSGGTCVPACEAAADNQGNVGCDFVVATPHFLPIIASPCYAVFVANNWDKDAVLTVERGGTTYDVTQFGRIPTSDPNVANWAAVPATGVPPGQVGVLFLSHDPTSTNGPSNPMTCPIAPALSGGNGAAVQGSGVGQAWHITADVPVSAYDIMPYGGADSFLPSAQVVFPTTAWGDNYIAVTPAPSTAFNPPGPGPQWGQIVAVEDGTSVTILPTVPLPGAGAVPATGANTSLTFTLNAREFVQWQGPAMTGSIIQADKRVSFTGGDGYICYSSATSSGGGCDSGHQQIPAVRALGVEYVAPPYRTRGNAPESIPYRLVGVVDGTTLTYDPPVAGAPATLSRGQSVVFESTVAFRVSSQGADNPFYVGQVMSGTFVPGNSSLGDEEYVNILPPAQWLSKYVFFTDPTYPTTNLVLVRKNPGSGFAPVTLGCAGEVAGWAPVGDGSTYEITNVDLIRNGTPSGACTNGPQVAESTAPFGLMVWGLDTFSSYAYPAGGNASTINTVVVPPVPE